MTVSKADRIDRYNRRRKPTSKPTVASGKHLPAYEVARKLQGKQAGQANAMPS